MIRGSFLARVQRERSVQGVQSFRANRASNIMPFSGQVFGSHEMLCLPAGQVNQLSVPVNQKLRLGEAIVRTGLPAWIVGNGIDNADVAAQRR
jgi:hypothetical protein